MRRIRYTIFCTSDKFRWVPTTLPYIGLDEPEFIRISPTNGCTTSRFDLSYATYTDGVAIPGTWYPSKRHPIMRAYIVFHSKQCCSTILSWLASDMLQLYLSDCNLMPDSTSQSFNTRKSSNPHCQLRCFGRVNIRIITAWSYSEDMSSSQVRHSRSTDGVDSHTGIIRSCEVFVPLGFPSGTWYIYINVTEKQATGNRSKVHATTNDRQAANWQSLTLRISCEENYKWN